MENKKGKRFTFPEDIQSDYNIANGISLKSFVFIILPFALIGVGVVLIPPYTVLLVVIRLIIGVLIAFIGLAIVIAKPITERQNITILRWLKYQQEYKNRQKLYYIKTRTKNHFLK